MRRLQAGYGRLYPPGLLFIGRDAPLGSESRSSWRDVTDATDGAGVLVAVRQSKTNPDGDTADLRYLKNGAARAVRTLRAHRTPAGATGPAATARVVPLAVAIRRHARARQLWQLFVETVGYLHTHGRASQRRRQDARVRMARHVQRNGPRLPGVHERERRQSVGIHGRVREEVYEPPPGEDHARGRKFWHPVEHQHQRAGREVDRLAARRAPHPHGIIR